MKANSTISSPFFFKPTLPSVSAPWRSTVRPLTPRANRRRPDSIELNDTLGRKQEIICAVILALCLLASFAVCLFNLAAR